MVADAAVEQLVVLVEGHHVQLPGALAALQASLDVGKYNKLMVIVHKVDKGTYPYLMVGCPV